MRPVIGKPVSLQGADPLSAARGIALAAVASSVLWVGLAITLSTVW